MPSPRGLGILSIILPSLILILAALTNDAIVSARQETGFGQAHLYTPTYPPEKSPWVVKAHFSTREQVNRVAERIEPWEVNYDQGFILLEVDKEQYQWLLDLGFQVEIAQELTEQLHRPQSALPGQVAGIPGYPCYRTVEETYATAGQIASAHPSLASWIDIGDSWKRFAFGSDSGQDMMVLRLTNALIGGDKPKLFVLSSIHGREYAPAELNTRFAEYLVNHYGTDADATWLLDYHEIHLLFHANPDGRERAEAGKSWRKNADNNYCSNTDLRGADLNRNFEFAWGCCNGSSDYVCDLTYRGPNPASEPETQAIQDYVRSIFLDQRDVPLTSPAPPDATGVFIDLHSYGELVLWPWGFTTSTPPNNTALRTLGRKFAYFNGYTPEQSIELYPTDGTTDDFSYGELGLASYTFELGTAFFQSCSTFEGDILADNIAALLYAAKIVRTPYQTPAGPDSYAVSISPQFIGKGQEPTLSATIDDTRYIGGEPIQPILAAEYYLDTPPWVSSPTTISHPMSALDGGFDEHIETVMASIDTQGLDPGKHILFVRGQDADGNWGPFSASFLQVLDQLFLPMIVK